MESEYTQLEDIYKKHIQKDFFENHHLKKIWNHNTTVGHSTLGKSVGKKVVKKVVEKVFKSWPNPEDPSGLNKFVYFKTKLEETLKQVISNFFGHRNESILDYNFENFSHSGKKTSSSKN